ncbi:mitochondrial aspartate-glutamate transporter agc1 [Elasticomyces elasticus]|nr:mitochondrial aspartate-glutamate transporter agc1 [Elasticomyces elasticus]
MATIEDTVEEKLVETEEEADIPVQTRLDFSQYALKDQETGEEYMTEREFIDAVAPETEDHHKIPRSQYSVLFAIADRRKAHRITLSDWATFESLLAKPDAEYEIAFHLFDRDSNGVVDFEEFKQFYNDNKSKNIEFPFDWDCEWVSLYLGGSKARHSMTYPQFAQMLRGLQGERIRQAFHYFDKNHDGYIDPEDFSRIIRQTAGHKLSDHLLSNLQTLCNISPGAKISYANVRAFQNVMRDMDLIELIIRTSTQKSADGTITRQDFLNESARTMRFSIFTPMEADILFHFASLDQRSGRLTLSDFTRVLDPTWTAGPTHLSLPADRSAAAVAQSTGLLQNVLTSAHHFLLGSIAGAFGAFMVYPIDLVKTRMQNQRSAAVGQRLYNNSIDCFRKVVRNEGFTGLYRGVLPQLVGVAPEKAIKLTINDIVRGKFTNEHGGIWWAHEILAGGSAGACQVIFTNPLEIVKIRLQVAGEVAKQKGSERMGAMAIVRNLGLRGLYKGASACLLRDVPFSAIYFPTYNHLKRDVFGEGPQKKLGVMQLLTSGAIAGMPAAYLTTPCDVIKTRLQVEARRGETAYTSLRHCAATVYKEEGLSAFFKGGAARVLRSSPQFAFTLAGYEVLQGMFPMHEGEEDTGLGAVVGGMETNTAPLPYLRSRNALKIINDLGLEFGRPKVPPAAEGKSGKGWLGFGAKA